MLDWIPLSLPWIWWSDRCTLLTDRRTSFVERSISFLFIDHSSSDSMIAFCTQNISKQYISVSSKLHLCFMFCNSQIRIPPNQKHIKRTAKWSSKQRTNTKTWISRAGHIFMKAFGCLDKKHWKTITPTEQDIQYICTRGSIQLLCCSSFTVTGYPLKYQTWLMSLPYTLSKHN